MNAKSDDQQQDLGVGKNGNALPSSPAFTDSGGVHADMYNVVRAETAKYLAAETLRNGTNKFRHERNGIPLDDQTVIRSCFDVVYSYAVFNVRGGLTVHVPDYHLYQSVQLYDENAVTIGMVHPGQTVTIDEDDTTHGHHVYGFMRTQPPSRDDKGMAEMRERQDAVTFQAHADDPFVSDVKYDVSSFNKLRTDLIARAPKETIIHLGFVYDVGAITPPHYQMTNLAGWAGMPARDALYFVVMPDTDKSRDAQPSSITFAPPNLQFDRAGFWSLTIYDADGWVVTDSFVINSREAKPNDDGTYTINFNGGHDAINNLSVPKNWNALFRCYLPVSVDEIVKYSEDFKKKYKVVDS